MFVLCTFCMCVLNFTIKIQFSSVAQWCLTLCDPMNCSTPGLPVHHQLSEFTQTHVHWVSDAIQPSHPLSSPSPPAPNPSQHQSLFQWVNSSHETYITVCEIDSQRKFAVWLRKLKQGLCIHLEGREMGWRFKREGIYVYLWLIHVEVWQKTTKFCKAIIL